MWSPSFCPRLPLRNPPSEHEGATSPSRTPRVESYLLWVGEIATRVCARARTFACNLSILIEARLLSILDDRFNSDLQIVALQTLALLFKSENIEKTNKKERREVNLTWLLEKSKGASPVFCGVKDVRLLPLWFTDENSSTASLQVRNFSISGSSCDATDLTTSLVHVFESQIVNPSSGIPGSSNDKLVACCHALQNLFACSPAAQKSALEGGGCYKDLQLHGSQSSWRANARVTFWNYIDVRVFRFRSSLQQNRWGNKLSFSFVCETRRLALTPKVEPVISKLMFLCYNIRVIHERVFVTLNHGNFSRFLGTDFGRSTWSAFPDVSSIYDLASEQSSIVQRFKVVAVRSVRR